MKNTIIKKTNVIISLWLIVIVAVLVVFGYELDNFGFYIASAVMLALLLGSNLFTIVYGIVYQQRYATRRETEYNNY